MRTLIDALRFTSKAASVSGTRLGIVVLAGASVAVLGQAPAPQPPGSSSPDASVSPVPTSAPSAAPVETDSTVPSEQAGEPVPKTKNPLLSAGTFSVQTVGGEISEDQLKQLLVGKVLYLRAGYLDNSLEFDEQGRLSGHSPTGSFTLSQIQIDKLKLSKHKLELTGDRYGLHFLGAAPYEDPTKATDRVKITPKKKAVHITFDREQVEKPKKEKNKRKHKHDDPSNDKDSENSSAKTEASESNSQPAKPASSDDKTTKTTDPAHASQLLLTALDKVFSPGIDDRMIAAMPDFWRLYYKAAAEKTDYRPSDLSVFHQNAVDQKARLISSLDPPSNEFAQANGVAGMALYHTVVGSDGKVTQVVAARPIGFGLDENAAQTILKASFQPATKDGKPVPVALDLVVSFRIYSKRTSQLASNAAQEPGSKSALPGPYTLQAFQQAQAAQQDQAVQPSQAAPQSQPTESTASPQ
jgi:hypothetical protein